MTPLSQEFLKSILHYDPATGIWTWLANRGRRKAGQVGGHLNDQGYIQLHILGKGYQAHRLAFLYIDGIIPCDDIDHINLDKSDNRYGNLREATKTLNYANKSRQRNNTSGYKGVTFHKQSGKWQARIFIHGGGEFLGLFSTPQEAHSAYCFAASRLFGEFARAA